MQKTNPFYSTKADNIKISRYGKYHYRAEIIKPTLRQKRIGISIAVGIFELCELKQWREVIKAYDKKYKR